MEFVKIGCKPEDYVQYKEPEDYVKMELNTFPLHYPPPQPPGFGIPEKWLKIMAKYKFSWRIIELAKAFQRKSRKKHGWKPPPPPEPKRKRRIKADPEIQYYTDQMSRPAIRMLEVNKKMYSRVLDSKHRAKLRRTIRSAWDSMYNYYKKKQRERYLRTLRIQRREKKPDYVFDRTDNLAMPKKLYKPKPKKPKQKKQTFKDCVQCRVHMNHLALPKEREVPKLNKLGVVKKSALRYLMSPETLKLTKPFPRFKEILPPLPLGKVKKGALLYQITERTETLAIPRKRTDFAGADDDDWNPFVISKWALRYRPTKRILELAKPRVRDPK